MGFWKNLTARFQPKRIDDPDFGELTYMIVKKHPERSYWEGEWSVPGFSNKIGVGLPGSSEGPSLDSREFYLSRRERLSQIIELARPKLTEAYEHWLKVQLPEDIFTVVKLASIDVMDTVSKPISWRVCFETTGSKWLYISVPFVDDEAQRAIVDS